MDCHAWYVTSVNGVQKGAWLTCCHNYFRSTPRTDYSYLELSLGKQRVRDSGIFEIARLQCTCCLGEKFHVNIKKKIKPMTSGLLTVLYLLGQLQLEIIINITFEDCSFLKSVRFRETGKNWEIIWRKIRRILAIKPPLSLHLKNKAPCYYHRIVFTFISTKYH